MPDLAGLGGGWDRGGERRRRPTPEERGTRGGSIGGSARLRSGASGRMARLVDDDDEGSIGVPPRGPEARETPLARV